MISFTGSTGLNLDFVDNTLDVVLLRSHDCVLKVAVLIGFNGGFRRSVDYAVTVSSANLTVVGFLGEESSFLFIFLKDDFLSSFSY